MRVLTTLLFSPSTTPPWPIPPAEPRSHSHTSSAAPSSRRTSTRSKPNPVRSSPLPYLLPLLLHRFVPLTTQRPQPKPPRSTDSSLGCCSRVGSGGRTSRRRRRGRRSGSRSSGKSRFILSVRPTPSPLLPTFLRRLRVGAVYLVPRPLRADLLLDDPFP